VTQSATVAADGSWTVSYAAADLPQGETTLDVTATATDAAGNTETLSDTVAFDTLVTNFSDTSQIGGTDGVINGAEAANGVTLTGTSEPGSAVEVAMGGNTQTTTAGPDGAWSVTYPASALPQGESTLPVTVTATDAAGNVATSTGTVEVDTLVTDFAITTRPGGADGVINAEEATQGLALTGTTEPGSTVLVSFAGATVPAVVAPDGAWTATFPASAIPQGEGTYEISATATDAAGNTETLTQPVVVDTVAGRLTISAAPVEGDDVVNAAEASDGVTLTGTSDPNQMVTVTLGGASHNVMTNSNGIWNATFAPGEIPAGTYEADITATITDAAGNSLVRTDSVMIDTEVDNFGISTQPIAGDGIVNGMEAANGFALTGTTEPGSSVTVVVEGVTRQASVDPDGNWTVAFGSNELPAGTYNASATVSTVDPAGNQIQSTTSFLVDTEVDRLNFGTNPIAGDGVVNAAEAAAGLTLTGEVEPGSTLIVTLNGVSHTATVDPAGNWSVTIAEADLPSGELDATITLNATDVAGNTRTESQVVRFDTVASDSPEVTDYTRNHTGLTGVSLEATEDAVYIGHLDGQGGVEDVTYSAFDVPNRGETTYFFDETVPDGSHLVVTGTDAAGNTAGTFHVVDDPKTNQVGMTDNLAQTLSVFEIETIDLQFAEDSQLTLTEAQITTLSAASDTVTITGGIDDTVTITGAQAVGQTTQDGQVFNVFVLGDATVQIEDDITNVVI
ncbi:Ig-like domain-containing protein, partial [Roseivivax sp. CAU 1753]